MATIPYVLLWAQTLRHLVPSALSTKMQWMVENKHIKEPDIKLIVDSLEADFGYPYCNDLRGFTALPVGVPIASIADIPFAPENWNVVNPTKVPCGTCNKPQATPLPELSLANKVVNLAKEAPKIALSGFLRVPQDVENFRNETCNGCDKFNKQGGNCTLCGCVMRIKTKFATSECPDVPKKWFRWTPQLNLTAILKYRFHESEGYFTQWLAWVEKHKLPCVIYNTGKYQLPETEGYVTVNSFGVQPESMEASVRAQIMTTKVLWIDTSKYPLWPSRILSGRTAKIHGIELVDVK